MSRATSSASITPGATTSQATCAASPSSGHQRRRRHAQGLQPRQLRPAQAARPRPCAAWCSPRCRTTTPPIEDYLGAEILGRIKRVLNRPIRVMGRFTQPLPNNWKLYVENVKDTYHASLLHLFFAHLPHHAPDAGRRRAGERRRRQPCELHHRQSRTTPDAGAYASRASAPRTTTTSWPIPALLDSVEEFGDDIQLQILSVFPGFILQQIHNCLAVRQVVPRGVERDGSRSGPISASPTIRPR